MEKYNTVNSVNILAPSPLIYDFFLGPTYVGFKEMRDAYILRNGEVEAVMQVVHKNLMKKI